MSLRCPQCAIDVETTWEWCHGCGYDPEGRRPGAGSAPALPYAPAAPLPPPPPPALSSSPYGTRPGAGTPPTGTPPTAPRPSGPARGRGSEPLIAAVVGAVLIVGAVAVVAVLGRDRPTAAQVEAAKRSAAEGPNAYHGLNLDRPRTSPSTSVGRGATTTRRPLDGLTWRAWTAPDGSFTIDFPGEPTIDSEPPLREGGHPLHLASVVGGTWVYHLAWNDATTAIGPSPDFDGFVDDLAADMVIESRSDAPLAGAPAVRVSGRYRDGDGVATVMYVVMGDRLYTLAAWGEQHSSYDFDRFLGSFHL